MMSNVNEDEMRLKRYLKTQKQNLGGVALLKRMFGFTSINGAGRAFLMVKRGFDQFKDVWLFTAGAILPSKIDDRIPCIIIIIIKNKKKEEQRT